MGPIDLGLHGTVDHGENIRWRRPVQCVAAGKQKEIDSKGLESHCLVQGDDPNDR